jgi:hypothetical protein
MSQVLSESGSKLPHSKARLRRASVFLTTDD